MFHSKVIKKHQGLLHSETDINHGGVCDVTQGDRTYSGQTKGFIGKLTNLKYDVLMLVWTEIFKFRDIKSLGIVMK